LWTVVTIYTTLAIAIFLVLRGLRRSEPWVQRLPGVAGLAADWGELPYLETLAALYGAGVPLKTSHGAAIATVPIAHVKSRLRIADGILQQGRPLREALGEAAALHQETRLLLATGEQAGQLESALGRALSRRREVLGRRVEFLGRTAGRVAYTAAVVAVVVIVWRFYSSYYGMLGR
jgi:type II secretory pathway component PulF